MSALRNFYDPKVPSRNLWTTIPGLITAILSILVMFGIFTPEQSQQLNTHLANIIQFGTGIYAAVIAIILMFKATG